MIKDTDPQTPAVNTERSYLNTILTVIAALLAVIAFDLVVGAPAPTEASAAGRSPGAAGQINPAVQRNEMIAELRTMNKSINEIKTTLGKTFNVEVVRMPAGGNED